MRRLNMMNWLIKLMLFRLMILVIQPKKNQDTKISKIQKRITVPDHSNTYITTKEFNDLTTENLPARLKHANLATKVDINDLVEKTDFDAKLKKFK